MIREWHQGEQGNTLAATIEHRGAGLFMGEGCRQAERHRAPHRRPLDAPGAPNQVHQVREREHGAAA